MPSDPCFLRKKVFHMCMVNTPSNDPPEKPDWLMQALNPIADAMEWVGRALYALFQTRIPQDLQKKGLTREKFEDFYTRFFERVRGHKSISVRNAKNFEAMLMADGWGAAIERKSHVFEDLLGEFGWQDDADIRAFLRDIFLDPGLA